MAKHVASKPHGGLTRGDAAFLIGLAATSGDSGELMALFEAPILEYHPLLRQRIVNALGHIRDRGATEALVQIARGDDVVRVRALGHLARTRDRALVPLFVEMLDSDDHEMRIRAIWGLGWSRTNEAVAPLIAALDDPRASIRAAAARGLVDIGDPIAIPHIRKAKNKARRPWRRYRIGIELKRLQEKCADR